MSRRAMVILILAIIAVHGILLWLVVATGSNEQKIAETRRLIEEENALRSGADDDVRPFEQADPAPSVQKPETGSASSSGKQGGGASSQAASTQTKSASSSAQTAASSQAKPGSPGKDPLAGLPVVKDKPIPSVPSASLQ